MTIELVCSITGEIAKCKTTAKGNPKLPRGWKWIGGQAYSAKAFADHYVLRAITCHVVSPNVDGNAQEMKAAWKVLDEQLKEAWEKSTEAANWAAKRLWANDVVREPGAKKCPAMPAIYLYGERDWTGWASSAAAVLRTIEQNYRKRRYEIVWTGSAGVPFVRYPYPYPLHNATWNLEQDSGGSMVFGCRLPSGRIAVRLRTKDKSGKFTMSSLKHLIDNPDLRGEAAILRKKDGAIAVKMVGYFPRQSRGEISGELRVRTDATSFLILLNEKDERLLVINGDWIRRKLAGHSSGLQRWREDQKSELRRPKRKAKKSAEDMQLACLKMETRLKTFIDQTAAQIVGHAARRRLAKVTYNDDEKTYFHDFAWGRLMERIATVCNREGIEFEWSGAAKKAATSRKRITPMETTT